MHLLVEEVKDTQCLVEAAAGGGKNYFITGPFMQAEIKNKNGRMYPLSILEREVNRYITEMVNERRSVGELAHPSTPNINHDRVSHLVTELRQQGNDFYGKAKILTEMPCGKIVKALIDEGIKFGVSSRGLGTTKRLNDGTNLVENNFYLAVAADVVHDPSAPAAFSQSLMEGKNWELDEATGRWLERNYDTVKQMNTKELEANALRLFESFLRSI
jgi:hypothetical protein